MGIRHVDPSTIPIRGPVAYADIQYQARRLEREGQIEPILLLPSGHADLNSWCYAEAQIYAACLLDWPTILVADS